MSLTDPVEDLSACPPPPDGPSLTLGLAPNGRHALTGRREADASLGPQSPPRKPRLAILGSRGIPARYGGFETFAEELSVRLVERGYDVTVLCERHPRPQPSEYRGVQLEYVPARGPGPLGTLWYDAASLWRARRRFDVVYMLGYGAGPFCMIPRLFGREVWINMDGIEWRRAKWNRLARLWLRAAETVACRAATRLIFDNGAVAEEVCSRNWRRPPHQVIEYGAPTGPQAEVPGPTVRRILSEYALDSAGYYLVVGRFEAENQIIETVRAFERCGATRPLCIVANSELDTPYVRRTLRHASDRVRFLGSIYDQITLRTLRTHCLAYVHGHSVGGTNLSLLEAMGCGNLTIAHDNPFNREVLRDGAIFYGDEADLTACFDECETMGENERRLLRCRARDRVATHYDWNRIVNLYADALPAIPAVPAKRTARARLGVAG